MKTERLNGIVTGLLRRSVVHFLAGISVSLLAFFAPRSLAVFLVGLATLAFLTIDLLRLRKPRLGALFHSVFRPFLRDYEATRITGASCLLIACTAALALFSREVAVLAVSFLAVGDPLARIARERFGHTRQSLENGEGALACLVGCAIVGVIWYYAGLQAPAAVIATGAVVATVAQGVSFHIDDNFTIPLLSGAAMWLVVLVV